jgi:hypothetical protein
VTRLLQRRIAGKYSLGVTHQAESGGSVSGVRQSRKFRKDLFPHPAHAGTVLVKPYSEKSKQQEKDGCGQGIPQPESGKSALIFYSLSPLNSRASLRNASQPSL